MGWLRWPFGRKSSITSSLDLWREIYGGAAAKSGVTVTAATALQASAVLACVRVIAEDTAMLPFDINRRLDARRRQPLPDHPVARLLDVQANDWQTALEFRETVGLHAALCGDGVAFKNVVRGRVAELVPILPTNRRITPGENLGDPPKYEFLPKSGTPIVLPRENVFHLRGPSWNSYRGLEAVRLAREAIGLSLATEEHAARLHSNGARPGGVLTSKTPLKPDQITQIKEAWKEAQEGVGNAYKTAVLSGDLAWQTIAMTGEDAQTIQTRKLQVEEICRFFRVSPQMVWSSDKTATYASAEQFFLAHVKYTILPWVRRWEQVIRRDLLTEREADLYPKFNLSALERADLRTRYAAYGQAIKDGWLLRNEARASEDLEPLDGLDEPLTPLNMATGSEPAPRDPQQEGNDAEA